MAMGNLERMASITVDGKRVPLSPDGLRSVTGSKEQVAAKIEKAITTEVQSGS